MTAPTDPVTRARQLLAAATPGPWGPTVYRGTGLGWDVDGPESGIRGQFDVEADAELIAAAPGIIADLLAEHDRLTHWKAEGTEVIESWERVYDALGDVGGLGQRRSDAVLAEVLRMKAELDQRTDPDLATLLVKNADRYDKRSGWETPMGEQMRAAARKLGGEA
jgi:hypothetical protein